MSKLFTSRGAALFAAALSVALTAPAAFGQFDSADDLRAELQRVKAERDQLRKELALAKLSMAKLKADLEDANEKLASLEGGQGATQDDADALAGSSSDWVLQVTAVTTPDIASLRSEVAAQRGKVSSASKRADDMAKRATKMAGERLKDRFGRDTKEYRYGEAEIGQARFEAQKAAREYQVEQRKLLGMERELKEAGETVTVVGVTEAGQAFKILAKGNAATIARTMLPNRTYDVKGPGRDVQGVIHIRLVSATPKK